MLDAIVHCSVVVTAHLYGDVDVEGDEGRRCRYDAHAVEGHDEAAAGTSGAAGDRRERGISLSRRQVRRVASTSI